MRGEPRKKELDGTLYRVFHAFGREFPVYYQYSDEDGRTIPNYMFYEQQPQYDQAGHPFVLSVMDGCPYVLPISKTENDRCCGNCRYFTQEKQERPAIFGLCLCEKCILRKVI